MKKKLLLNYLAAVTSRNLRKNTTRFNGLLALFLMVMGMGVSWGQTATQNFGTTTGSNTSQTGSTTLIAAPTVGTSYARAGATAPNAPVVLVTASNPLGTTGAFARCVASTSASVTKMSPWVGYTGGTEFYTSFKVLFGDASAGSTATSGVWKFYQGAGAMYSDVNDFSGTQVFTGLTFTYGAGGALALTYRAGSTNSTTGLTTTSFSSGTVYKIEIVGNNKSSGTISYTYGGTSQTVAVQKFDLYVNGTLIGDDLAEAQLPANTSITSGTFIGVSSTSNVANIFVDDALVYNAVPAAIGTASLTPPTLTASGSATVDNNFNITFPDDATWRGAITAVKYGSTTLTATTDYTTSSGAITLIPSGTIGGILRTAGSATVTVVATGYSDATVTQNIGAGAASKLSITTQPTAPSTNGAVLAAQPVVAIQDQYGNVTSSSASVTAAVSAGNWSLGGTTSVGATSGTTTFSGLTATSSSAVTGATIAFSSGSLTGVTSGTFNIPAPPTAPLAPTSVVITPGSNQLSVAFTTGGDGGLAITNYKYSIDGGTSFVACSPSQTTSPIVITGLTNGTTYNIQIKAVNAIGDGTATASTAATPLRTSLTTDYYRSRTTGNWGTAATWESSADAITWGTATLSPTSSANTITILNSYNVIIAAAVTADQLVIETGATLTNSSGLTIANGTGTDLTISGALTNSSSFLISVSANVIVNGSLTQTVGTAITTSGSLEFTANGIYNHQTNGGTIPTASWNAASTCNVTGMTSSNPSGLGQTFGNFIWNNASQSTFYNFNNSSFSTSGTFTVSSTGSSNISLVGSTTTDYVYSFGSMVFNGGTFNLSFMSTSTGGFCTVNIANSLTVNGGSFSFAANSGNPSSASYISTLNIGGDLLVASGAIFGVTGNGANQYGLINMNKSGSQNLNVVGTSNIGRLDYDIANTSITTLTNNLILGKQSANSGDLFTVEGTLITGTNAISQGSSTTNAEFKILAGGTINTSNSGGLIGTISVGGTKTFTAGANYIFNGNTTTPYPTGTFGNPASLTFNANVVSNRTSSLSVSGAITINNGARYSFNPANATDGFTLPGTLTIAAGGTFDSAGENNITNSGGTGSVVVNGTFITRDTQGLKGTGTTLPSVALILNAGSTVEYGGTNQTISAFSNYKNVTFSGAGPFIVQPNTVFSFSETADFGGKAVVIKSDANGTGAIGQVTGTLTGANNVTVERYIPAKRAWRALTAPVVGSTNNSVFYNWQNNGTSGIGTATGVEIWSNGSGLSGVTSGGTGSSLLTYNSSTNNWTGVTNTNTTSLFSGAINNPFMVFVTGPYASTSITSGSSDTTLKATGSLISGTQTYASNSGEYTFIGNPYASPLDLSLLLNDSENSGFNGYLWIWDAKAAGNNSLGGYNLFDTAANSSNGGYTNTTNTTGSAIDNTTKIQSGQAFFVKSASTANFKIKEAHKSNLNSNAVFRTGITSETLRVGLFKQENNQWIGRDGAMEVIFSEAEINQMPNKMANSTENIAFTKNGQLFASEHHLPLIASDVLNVKVWNTTAGANYKLKINTEAFTSTHLSATLEDLFTNSRTPLNLEGAAVEYPFTVTTDALSSGDRFRIVFQNAVLGTNNPTANGFQIVPNPVTGDSFQVNLGTLATGTYSYSICNAIGQEVEKGTLNNATQNTNYEVKMSTAATGIYVMKIKGSDNSEFTAKIIKK